MSLAVSRADIARVYPVIAPHIRRTPTIAISGGDFGLPPFPLTLKLEQLQHAGSFKTRGAFANLLTRHPPADRCRRRVWRESRRGGRVRGDEARHPGADLRADGLLARQDRAHPRATARISPSSASATPRRWRPVSNGARTRARCRCTPSIRSRRSPEPGTVALELSQQAPDLDTVLVAVGGGGLIGGIAALVRIEEARRRRRT